MDEVNDDDAAMMALMGFGGFDTTKVYLQLPSYTSTIKTLCQGKPVTGNESGAVNIKKQRTWRQYMNRHVVSALVR